MNQPDVLSQIQPEGEHNAEEQAGPEESEIPADPSEGRLQRRFSPPRLPFLVRDDDSELSKQGLGLLEPLQSKSTRLGIMPDPQTLKREY